MPSAVYTPEVSMREARALYFAQNQFGDDGGYHASWVHFKLGPIPLTIPNTAARVRAVAIHDLHHVVTGYGTDFRGEFEISAWEIGAGCRDFLAAWFINLGGVAGGLLCAPRRTLRAFVRGRQSRSLYGRDVEALLALTVGEVQREITRAERVGAPASAIDLLLFAASALAGLLTGSAMFVLGLLLTPVLLGLSLVQPGRATAPAPPGA